MSRESLDVTAPGADDGPTDDLDLSDDVTDLAGDATDLDATDISDDATDISTVLSDAAGGPDDDGLPDRRPGRRRFTTWAVVPVVVAGLLVGALGGATSARQLDQGRLDDAARVVVALDAGFEGAPDTGPLDQDDLITVDVSLTGVVSGTQDEGAQVERLSTPIGDFRAFPPVEVGPGTPPARTLLRGRIDCDPVRRTQAVDGHLLDGSTATVRLLGSIRRVPVRVLVANPEATLFAAAARCTPGADEFAAPFGVVATVNRTDGTIELTVSPAPQRGQGGQPPYRLTLLSPSLGDGAFAPLRVVRSSAQASTFEVPLTAWTITTTPRLPAAIVRPTSVRLALAYTCPPAPATGIPPAMPDFPYIVLGAVDAVGQAFPDSRDWDPSALGTAATAAASLACTRR